MAIESDSHLFVDLDGTLIRTDLLFESLLHLIRRNPLYLLLVPLWLLRGRARLKHQLARRVALDPIALPYHAELLAWLREERDRGRRMTLITASDQAHADAVAGHLGLALVKRVTELVKLPAGAITGRAYHKHHEGLLSVIGAIASLLAVIVFAFYINASATTDLYRTPLLLWLIVPLLLVLLSRIWRFARAGKLHEDPVLFAVKDRLSQLFVLAAGSLIWLAA